MSRARIRIGIAGWSLPAAQRERCGGQGTHLERYARLFDAVEINSSFYRPHRRATYERWAGSVPGDFRFAVKTPRAITHESALIGTDAALERFVDEVSGLGRRLGVILVQLPASLELDRRVARRFFARLRGSTDAAIVCEPRHGSWFEKGVDTLLRELCVVRAAADPARHTGAGLPGGRREVTYTRLHGSPRMYRSSYDPAYLARIASRVRAEAAGGSQCWVVFDNTAELAAWDDAFALRRLLRE